MASATMYEQITIVTDAAAAPVELYEFKDYARAAGFSAHDAILQVALNGAVTQAEQRARRYFVDRVVDVTFSEMDGSGVAFVRLPMGPVAITSVTTRDDQGALVETLASATYRLLGNRLYFSSEPGVTAQFGGLVVRYTAGFGTTLSPPLAVPASLKLAIMKLAMRSYSADEGQDPKYEASLKAPIPSDVAAEIDQYRIEVL
ncbi:Phage conserved hypothetical protein [uncultured Caudovirales phage]|uniref:Gp6 domain containing protein n=1 Tax=uncultured Caudovirales phage TaxID=2100421 RepID=A0A6J5QIP0_9CAUD|nr:Phage conserved hypothetical protein [uncultured Caudovirales phage]